MLFYYFYFIIYSFLGWCMESTIYTFKKHRFINRGFLNGPLCPIYGVGMIIIIFCLHPFYNNIAVLFILGMILASSLEYGTGYLLEKLFKTRWWDYTNKKFNLNGYICLQNSLYWGILCVLMIHVIQPVIGKAISLVNPNFLQVTAYISIVILVIDIFFTIKHLVEFNSLVKDVNKVKANIEIKVSQSTALKRLHDNLINNEIKLKAFIEQLSKESEFKIDSSKITKKLKSAQLKRMLTNYKISSRNYNNQETISNLKNNLNND